MNRSESAINTRATRKSSRRPMRRTATSESLPRNRRRPLDESAKEEMTDASQSRKTRSSAGSRRSRSSRRTEHSRPRTSEGGNRRRPRSSRIRTCEAAVSKSLLDSPTNEEKQETAQPRESISLGDFTKSIQRASTMHYSRRDVSKRRAAGSMRVKSSMHNSLSALDQSRSSRHSMGGSSRRQRHSDGSRRRRHGGRTHRHRRSKDQQPEDDTTVSMDDESIPVLQFDCKRMDGLNIVDANNVHSRVSRNNYVDKLTVLLPEDLSVAVTDDTASLENSFSSSVVGDFGDELPLMLSNSEDNDTTDAEEEKDATKMTRRKTNAFKAVSKLLATPMTRRKSVVKTDLLDMSVASLHI